MKTLFNIFLVIFFTISSAVLYSQDKGMAFLTYGVPQFIRTNDARGSSMGMTGVAGSQSNHAPYTNPAGFAAQPGIEILAGVYPSRNIPFSEATGLGNQEMIGLSYSFPQQWRIAGYYTTIDYGTFGEDDDDASSKSYFINQYMVSLSKSFGHIAIGANIRYTDQKLDALSGTALTCDAGIKFLNYYSNPSPTFRWHSLGASVSNIISEFKSKSDHGFNDPLPQMLRLGLAWGSESRDPDKNGNIEYNTEIEFQSVLNSGDYKWNHIGAGVELVFFKYLFGNIGYHFDLSGKNKRTFSGEFQGLTYGLGFKTPRPISDTFPLILEARYAKGIQPGKLEIDPNIISFRMTYPLR